MRARQPSVGGPGGAGGASGGRREGQLLLDPHPDRVPLHDEQPPHRLAPQDRGGAGAERTRPPLSPGARARRLLVHQRNDLHARPEPRLRPVAAARERRLGMGRRAPLLHPLRGPRRRRRRPSRGGRGMAGRAPADLVGAARRVPRSGGGGRDPEDRRLQPRRQRGVELLPGEPAERGALEHRPRVPPPGAGADEPRRRDPCAGEADRGRGRGTENGGRPGSKRGWAARTSRSGPGGRSYSRQGRSGRPTSCR